MKVEYNVADAMIEHAIETRRENKISLKPEKGVITLRLLLIDRSSLEIYGNNGRVVDTEIFPKTAPTDSVKVYSHGGSVKLTDLKVRELKSTWREQKSFQAARTQR